MAGLSNFLLRRNDGAGLSVRPARRAEFDAALRLIAAGTNGGDGLQAEFASMLSMRGLDLTSMWVVADESADRVEWAALPLMLPGRAMLLMVPPRLRPRLQNSHVAELVAGVLMEPRRQGATLAQVLLDPAHRAVHRAMLDSGFEDIAELMYLGRRITSPIHGRLLGDRYRLWRYDRTTHFRFATCIQASYVDSLDCPKLNGRRDIEDIMSGHKATGDFDPELWMLLSDLDDNDLGVMLVNRLANREGYELVYLGLTQQGRGQGLADALIRTAITALANEGGGQIITACDSQNAPARKLYHRNGFGFLYSRQALVRDLSTKTPTSIQNTTPNPDS
jgi:mycothiol synthase